MGEQRDQRKQRQQRQRGAQDCQDQPLAPGLDVEVRPRLIEGDFQLPAQQEPLHHLRCGSLRFCARQSLGLELSLGVGDEHPVDAYRGQVTVLPDCRCRCQSHASGRTAIPLHARFLTDGGEVVEPLLQGRLPCPSLTWASRSPCRVGICRVVHGCIQAQAHHDGDRLAQALAGGKQFAGGIVVVGHNDQHALGQPLTNVEHYRTHPVGVLCVARAECLMRALGGRKRRQQGPRPGSLRPGDGRKQHHPQPVLATRFHKERARQVHRVAVDTPGLDFVPAPTLAMVVVSQHDWCVERHKGIEEQAAQDAVGGRERPNRAVEPAVVVLELRVVAQSHHAQDCGDGTFAWRQDGADEQDFVPSPCTLAAQQFALVGDRYNRSWQVAHSWSFPGSRVPIKRALPPVFRLPNG